MRQMQSASAFTNSALRLCLCLPQLFHSGLRHFCASTVVVMPVPGRKVNAKRYFKLAHFTGPLILLPVPTIPSNSLQAHSYHPHLVYFGDKHGWMEGAPEITFQQFYRLTYFTNWGRWTFCWMDTYRRRLPRASPKNI
jgi:hypothetical protein